MARKVTKIVIPSVKELREIARTPAGVSQGLQTIRELRDMLTALDRQIEPLERKRQRVARCLEAVDRNIRCKLVQGCRGYRGHMGVHNV